VRAAESRVRAASYVTGAATNERKKRTMDPMPMKIATFTVGLIGVLVLGSPALGHGEKQTTNPKENATVGSPPGSVSVTLTEPPTRQSVLEVLDGCRRDVVGDVSVNGRTIRAAIGKAEPGRWRASFEAVSAIDGHPTRDEWTFTVRGKRDCSGSGGEATGGDGSPEGGSAVPPEQDGGAEFPVVPVALGAAGLIGLALVVRMTSR
jgi:copper resistance protein C